MKKLLFVTILFLVFPFTGRADRDEIEEVFNRYGGPPLYRYYHHLPAHNYRTSYYDANDYWASKYYGNREPDPEDVRWLDRELMDIE